MEENFYEPDYYKDPTTGEWKISVPLLVEKIKAKRLRLLYESDWTDLLSAKPRLGDEVYNQWQTYRQALRDITEQAGYPLNIEWPTKP
jgi:hypothetical protein